MNKLSLAEQMGWRFIEAGLTSAFSTAATITYFTGVQTWEQFSIAINALALSLIIGFVSGVLMAVTKYFKGVTTPIDSTMPEGLVE